MLKLSAKIFVDKQSYYLHFAFRYWNITFENNRNKTNAEQQIIISIFGIKIHHKLKSKEKEKPKEKEKKEDNVQKDSPENTLKTFKAGVNAFLSEKDSIFKALSYFSDKLIFNQLKNTIEIGFDDAAYTAIASGLCYTLLSPILGFLLNHFRIKENHTNVVPHFNETILSFNTELVISIRTYCLVLLFFKIIRIVSQIQTQYKLYKKGEIENE